MPSEIQPPFKVKLDNGKVLHSFLSIGYGFTSDCDIESEYLRFLVSYFSVWIFHPILRKFFVTFLECQYYFCKAPPTINPTHFKIIFNYSVQERKEENICLRISILCSMYTSLNVFFSVLFKGQIISKANLKFLFEPKIERKYFSISGLVKWIKSKKGYKLLYQMINNH